LQVDRRSSSAWSYLYPQTQQRAGLTVLTEHIVDTVLTTTESNGAVTATGVTVQPALGGQTISFKATREVIVSAGALYVRLCSECLRNAQRRSQSHLQCCSEAVSATQRMCSQFPTQKLSILTGNDQFPKKSRNPFCARSSRRRCEVRNI
jgi:hypothetical protein